jgi:hypothetical protein
VVVAVLAVLGVVAVTVVLLFVLAPSDEEEPLPSNQDIAPLTLAPASSVPGDTSASSAPPSSPTESIPDTTTASAPPG